MKVILRVPDEGYLRVPDEGYFEEPSSGMLRITFIRYTQNNLHQVCSE
jgi:hypothetical protein